jgi:hypothetical protein
MTTYHYENNDYKKCHEQGHQFTSVDEEFTFEEYKTTLECVVCGASVEVEGDIRTDDSRHIGWVVTEIDEPPEHDEDWERLAKEQEDDDK